MFSCALEAQAHGWAPSFYQPCRFPFQGGPSYQSLFSACTVYNWPRVQARMGFPDGSVDEMQGTFDPGRRKWQSTPVFLPGKSLGQRIWQATVQGVTKSRTQLNNWTITTTRQERQISQFSLSFWAQDRLCLGCEFYLKALHQGIKHHVS